MKNISIIIPYHRNKKMLLTSLRTLQESLNDTINPEIIIVANNINSHEIQLDLNKNKYKVLQFNQNLFYPEAIRRGVQIASGDYLIFADPDIFYCENWLEQMIACFQRHSKIGCVGAKLINPNNNRILDFGIGYHGYHTIHIFRGLPYDHELCNADLNVQSICSALFLIDHTLFDTLNGFDNEMPYAYCDNDLCLRIKDKGYEIWGAAHALAYHKGNTDFQNSKYYAFQYLREDCIAAFFYKNVNRYYNDFERFFYQSQMYFNITSNKKGYIFVNLSTAYDWKSYMQIIQAAGITILDISEGIITERDIYKLDFFNIIDMCLIAAKTPLVYFVDSFMSCYENSLWFSLRDIHNDIIIDRNANCIPGWYISNNFL